MAAQHTFKSFNDITVDTFKAAKKPLTEGQKIIKERKQTMRKNVPEILKAKGVVFESKSNGALLLVKHASVLISYWPGAGRWEEQKVNPRRGWGIQSLFEYLGVET